MFDDAERHARTIRLIGGDALHALRSAHVTVIGLGGVGGACAEALARAGIGRLTLIDYDTVSPSNLNRQCVATMDTVGLCKSDAAAARVRAIDPGVSVHARAIRIARETADVIPACHFVIDAVDDCAAKVEIALHCKQRGIPMAASMGAANRLDPTAFRVTDIYLTRNDPLARVMRKRYRDAGIEALTVVCSEETPVTPPHVPGEAFTPASVSFVPPAAGLALASVAVRAIINAARRPYTVSDDSEALP